MFIPLFSKELLENLNTELTKARSIFSEASKYSCVGETPNHEIFMSKMSNYNRVQLAVNDAIENAKIRKLDGLNECMSFTLSN